MQAPGLRPIWDDRNLLVLSLTLVLGAARMALQVKILATKPDDLISILGTYVVEARELTPSGCPLTPLLWTTIHGMHTPTCVSTRQSKIRRTLVSKDLWP